MPHYLPQSQSSGPQPTTQSVILKLGTSISTSAQQCIAAAPDGSLSLKDVDHAKPHLDTVFVLYKATASKSKSTSVTEMLKLEDGKQYRIRSMDRQKFLVWTESNGVTCTGTGNEDSSKLPFFILLYQ